MKPASEKSLKKSKSQIKKNKNDWETPNWEIYWDYEKNKNLKPEKITLSTRVWLKYSCHDESRLTTPHNLRKSKNICQNCHHKKLGKLNSLPKYNSVADIDYLIKHWSPNNKINPEKVSYKSNKKFLFLCYKCKKEFLGTVYNRFLKKNCYLCSPQAIVSKKEDLFYLELKKHFNGIIERNPRKGRYSPDLYFPELNKIIEFYGDYWHGDEYILQKTGKSSKEYHKDREQIVSTLFNSEIYTIKECDWDNNPDNVIKDALSFLNNQK